MKYYFAKESDRIKNRLNFGNDHYSSLIAPTFWYSIKTQTLKYKET